MSGAAARFLERTLRRRRRNRPRNVNALSDDRASMSSLCDLGGRGADVRCFAAPCRRRRCPSQLQTPRELATRPYNRGRCMLFHYYVPRSIIIYLCYIGLWGFYASSAAFDKDPFPPACRPASFGPQCRCFFSHNETKVNPSKTGTSTSLDG
jgi:hypothetical protein